jgi:thymidylate synthase (FAD)
MPARIIKPYFEIWDDDNKHNLSTESAMKHIERAGRVCYKSEEKITETSFLSFWDNIVVKKQHHSIMEHAVQTKLIATSSISKMWAIMFERGKFDWFKYFRIDRVATDWFMMTGNLRAWDEFLKKITKLYIHTENWSDDFYSKKQYNIGNDPVDLEYDEEYDKTIFFRHRSVTVKFVCDLGVAAEIDRHRVFGFSEESTRFINYKDDGKTDGMNFIDIDTAKSFFKLKDVTDYQAGLEIVREMTDVINDVYTDLSKLGFPAEWTRCVIPKMGKCEVVMTGYLDYWHEFFKLRADKDAHPQMRELVIALEAEFKTRGWTC